MCGPRPTQGGRGAAAASDRWLESAALAGRLSAETAQVLADESSGLPGALLALRGHGENPTIEKNLKADINARAGQVAMVESVRTMHPGAAQNEPTGDRQPRRLGFDAPTAEVNLHATATAGILAACGVPVTVSVDSDGTGQRESFRRFLHSTMQPLGSPVAGELSEKLEVDVSLSFDRLLAVDLSGRARAFQSLVGAGMDPGEAAALAGLLESDG